MLKKKYVLRKSIDFKNVFGKGRKIRMPLFDLFYIPNKKSNSRFGFIVTLKISKKAVERNKIKRLLRRAVMILMNNLKNKNDIIVITKPNIKNKVFDEVFYELENSFKKINNL